MRKRHGKLTVIGLVFLTGFYPFTVALGGTPDVVGKVIRSSNATVEGSALLSNGTILSGDAVNVGEGGSLVLRYSPTGRAALTASTQVRFSGANGNIVAQLLSGTLAVERENRDAFVVKTSTYRVEPQGEGKAEFVVALMPDNRTLVEAQHGKVAITETKSGETYTLAEGLLAQIPAPAVASPSQEGDQSTTIGTVLASTGASQNTKAVPIGARVLVDDLFATGATGHAVIQFWPTNQITLQESTSASFTKPADRVWLHLRNGTIVVDDKGDSNILVTTEKFHIEPNTTVASRFKVGIMADSSTYIESVSGDVRIRDIQSDQVFLLPAGQKTLVAANASGVPGLQALQENPAPAPTQTTSPSNPHPAAASGGMSHNTLIIIGVAAGGGIAGAVAALAGGKGSSSNQPVSPSVP
jgi:ferric-dicitrate binding protein FerR (iron transport regulator)